MNPVARLGLLTLALLSGLAAFRGAGLLALLVPGLLALALQRLALLPSMGLAVAWGALYCGLFHIWAWSADRSGWILILLFRGLPWLLLPFPQALWERWRGEQGGLLTRALLCGLGWGTLSALLVETPFGLDWDLPLAALAPWPQTLALLPWLGLCGGSAVLGTLSHLLFFPARQGRAAGGVVLVVLLATSLWIHHRPETPSPLPRIGLLQTRWPQEQKWLDINRDLSKELLRQGTEQAAGEGAQMVIWPETAWPVQGLRSLEGEREQVAELARRLGVELLASSWETAPSGWQNVVTRVAADGTFGEFQSKRRLIPFQEYLPFPVGLEKLFRARGWYRSGARFRPGAEAVVFESADCRFGVLICYESVTPGRAREVAEQVDFLVVVTNDASLLGTWPKEAHFRSAVLRAIECRRPVLQAANSGVGGWIDERGRVVARAKEASGVSVLMVGSGGPSSAVNSAFRAQ